MSEHGLHPDRDPAAPDWAKFWRDPALDNLELLRATYITHRFPPHAHDEFAIGVIESGAQAFVYRNRHEMVMPAGSIALVNPGELHVGYAATQQGWTYRMLYPSADLMREIASHMADQARDVPFFPVPIVYDRDLFFWLQWMHRTLEDPHAAQLTRESVLIWALSRLILRHADDRVPERGAGSESGVVDCIRRYLEAHYAEKITLADLAAQVHMNPYTVLRVFKREIGLPPHAYLLQFRIRQARRQLRTGVSIAEVAAATGFADQSHLTRVFKRIVGVTPGDYQTQR